MQKYPMSWIFVSFPFSSWRLCQHFFLFLLSSGRSIRLPGSSNDDVGLFFFFVCSCLLSVLSAMWSRVNRMHRTVTSATFSSMYFFIKWSYLIRNLISNVRMSHSITDVSSDPVSRYCELFGTSKHVTAPV